MKKNELEIKVDPNLQHHFEEIEEGKMPFFVIDLPSGWQQIQEEPNVYQKNPNLLKDSTFAHHTHNIPPQTK